jgi:uncharacterized protein (TIGR02145 family)
MPGIMKNQIQSLIMLLMSAVFYLNTYSQEKLAVEGAIIIKNSEDPSPEPGTIRWTGADFQGWNGVTWVSLTGKITVGSVTDLDGNTYKTIKIGTQEWMVENLRTTKYKNGNDIQLVTDDTDWENANYGAWCWYNNDNNHEVPYGKIYNWYAVNDGRGLCPTGWHVPSHEEWTTLTTYLGGDSIAGGKMKEEGTTHWSPPNMEATNESGFTGLPGGVRFTFGSFGFFSNNGYWWSSTGISSSAWYRVLDYNSGSVTVSGDVIVTIDDKRLGLSVRCVRD